MEVILASISGNKTMNSDLGVSTNENALQILTVTEFSAFLKKNLESFVDFVWITGEVSGLFKAQSGHFYCQLKDQGSQVRLVLFKGVASKLLFTLEEGMQVIVCAQISMYQPRGELQLIARKVEPEGLGALKAAYDQLKKKLLEEGLFQVERKKSLPQHISTIGLLTSKDGAVIHDMVHVIRRRNPLVKIIHYVTPVQGKGSINKVISTLEYAASEKKCDLYILARGGGSLEDLWTFNTESVVRAVSVFPYPIISAIGHETDHSLCDYVADLRAPTPSIAAELATNDLSATENFFRVVSGRLLQALKKKILSCDQALDYQSSSLKKNFHYLLMRTQELFQRFYKARHYCLIQWKHQAYQMDQYREFFSKKFPISQKKIIAQGMEDMLFKMNFLRAHQRRTYDRLYKKLESAFEKFSFSSYRKTLSRGFSLVLDNKGTTVKKACDIKNGESYRINFVDGEVHMKAAEKNFYE